MQQDILNELNEINLCSYCYIRSNEQERDDWFCLPCEPQHELVYAKAKGYPYWPAKASAPYSFYLFLDNVCFKINKNRFLKSVAIFTTFDFLDPNMRDWRLIKATQNRLIVTSIHQWQNGVKLNKFVLYFLTTVFFSCSPNEVLGG